MAFIKFGLRSHSSRATSVLMMCIKSYRIRSIFIYFFFFQTWIKNNRIHEGQKKSLSVFIRVGIHSGDENVRTINDVCVLTDVRTRTSYYSVTWSSYSTFFARCFERGLVFGMNLQCPQRTNYAVFNPSYRQRSR